jgi:hypothetical protein
VARPLSLAALAIQLVITFEGTPQRLIVVGNPGFRDIGHARVHLVVPVVQIREGIVGMSFVRCPRLI